MYNRMYRQILIFESCEEFFLFDKLIEKVKLGLVIEFSN